jgi:hypothetical protein
MDKNRNKGFPVVSLNDCIRIIEKASKSGRIISNAELSAFRLKEIGKLSAYNALNRSGAFARRRASLKQFGLIEYQKEDKVNITDLAMDIVYGDTPEKKERAKKNLFLKPELFARIYNELPKNTPVNKTTNIGNKAVGFGLVGNSRETFVKSFVESGQFAGLVEEKDKDTVVLIPYSEDNVKSNPIIETSILEDEQSSKKEIGRISIPIKDILTFSFSGGIELTIPSNIKVTTAILEGKLGEVSKKINEFANEVYSQKGN